MTLNYRVLRTRGPWKFSLVQIPKNVLQEWSMVKNLSCVSCAAWNVFPINSLLTTTTIAYRTYYFVLTVLSTYERKLNLQILSELDIGTNFSQKHHFHYSIHFSVVYHKRNEIDCFMANYCCFDSLKDLLKNEDISIRASNSASQITWTIWV